MRALPRSLALLVCVVALGGCDSRALRWDSSDTYTVQSGDTVYAIAFRFGLAPQSRIARKMLSVCISSARHTS